MRKVFEVACPQCDAVLTVDAWHYEATFWQPEEFDWDVVDGECECSYDDMPEAVQLQFYRTVNEAFWKAVCPVDDDGPDVADWWEERQAA